MNIALSNVYQLPLSMALFLADDNYDGRSPDPYNISVTTLLKSTRQIVLGKRLPDNLMMDISENISSRLGQAYHKAVEDAWLNKPQETMKKLGYPSRVIKNIKVNPTEEDFKDNPDLLAVYVEQRTEKKVGKWTITGQFDFIVLGVLEDIKSTSVYGYLNQSNTDKFIKQGSLYKWLNPTLVTEDYMLINYIFTDWSGGRARTDKSYPSLKMMPQTLKLKSTTEMDKFVKNKLKEVEKNIDKPESDLPYCSDEDLWRSPTVYKYYAKPDSTRSSKNFDSLYEAQSYAVTKSTGRIEIHKGEVKACKYCAAYTICSQKDEYLASGELKLK